MVQECNIMIYVEVRTRLKLNIKMKCFQDRRPQWFAHMEEWEENVWSSKCRTFNNRGCFPGGQTRKTPDEVIRNDL